MICWLARGHVDLLQYRFHRRTIRRADSDMMQDDDSIGVYEYIPAALENVPLRLP